MSHEPSGWRAQTSMNFPESVCVSRPPAKGGHSRLPKRCARIVLANPPVCRRESCSGGDNPETTVDLVRDSLAEIGW
jgi:hypothetical protein